MRVFIFSVLMSCSCLLDAQIRFQHAYSYQGDEAGNCLVTYGQNILAGGQSDDGNTQYAFLVDIGILGDTLWTRHIGAPFTNCYGLAVGTGTKFAVACGGLVGLDIPGNLLWARQGNGEFRGVIYYGSGYYAAGNDSSGALLAWNIDMNGDTIWTHTYTSAANPVFRAISSGGGIQPYIAANSDSGIVILQVDFNGIPIWNKTYRFPDALSPASANVNDVYRAPLGDLLVVGSYQDTLNRLGGFLLRTDAFGNVISMKTYKDPNGLTNTFLNSVTEDYPNYRLSLFGSGEANFNGSHCMYLLKTDLAGDTIWTCGYRNGDDFGAAHALLPNKSFAMVGTTFGAQGNMYVVQADSTGNAYCNMEHFSRAVFSDTAYVDSLVFAVGFSPVFNLVNPVVFSGCSRQVICSNVGMNEEISSAGICIFPNPSNGNFTIRRSQNEEDAAVLIYDANGRKLLQMKIPAGQTEMLLTADLAPGLYLVRIVSGTENSASRMVVGPGNN